MGARGNRMLRLAAREADIIGIQAGGEGPGSSLSEKVAVIREAAGERYNSLELTQLFFNVQVDGQPAGDASLQNRGSGLPEVFLSGPVAKSVQARGQIEKIHGVRCGCDEHTQS